MTPKIPSFNCSSEIFFKDHRLDFSKSSKVLAHLGSRYEKNLKILLFESCIAPAPYAPPFSLIAECKYPFLRTAPRTVRAGASS